ncbi:MAG: PQQ-binding-like beta-propeller repeat protein, partial [Verrucomicrobia bacterium]|nr:PQQ-binding-like beta-propeller repeat protein [Verrucomicrobiota bacterium]
MSTVKNEGSKLVFVALLMLIAPLARSADWPMWKHNSGRTAVSPGALSTELHLQWVRQLPPARQAWKDKSNAMLFFDVSYEPIVAGKLMFVGSMNSDSVTAYSTETGAEKWRFYTDGPVRFAPVAYKGNVYAASDDGYLYCLKGADGKLVWKMRGSPADRKILGNERLINIRPVRGAPVIHDDILYFAAGIWPFMGTFIYALDPETGETIWVNSGNGSRWITQQHGAPSFAGVAPQGYLALT